ncbi:hypothetical protein [Rhodopirellula halodulae]|uniref:hypothetical protein n=1 Tax=Rhodopirellula halodulae TaxID=2894198 RepID=UPI001E4F8A4A|nr:hypothetical protein [Rhodopirellula sp. JC737]MCC9654983.1 hypothetical protein [Rhodopirellula sp. JC737]
MIAASTSRPRNWLAWLLLIPLVVGCDGCRPSDDGPDEPTEEQTKLPPLTIDSAKAFPATRPDAGTKGTADGAIKPGHWFSASIALRSNHDDERGVIQTETKVPLSKRLFASEDDTEDTQQKLEDAAAKTVGKPFRVRRPAVLPRGQRRVLDTRALAPEAGGRTLQSVGFDGDYVSSRTGSPTPLRPSTFAALPSQTFFFVILTERSEKFTLLQTADWVEPHRSVDQFYRARENYRVVIPPTQGVLPLSETMLDWTSTSVLFWDDLTSSALTPGQRVALTDWIHFGGTLIVNGPIAADAIEDASLRKLLPIEADGNQEVSSDDAIAFLESHRVRTDESIPAIAARLRENSSTVVVAGQPHPDAEALGAGDMVYQRRIGRGRIVQSRVDLMTEWMTAWKSYHSFFNSAILARPPRKRKKTNYADNAAFYDLQAQNNRDLTDREIAALANRPSIEQTMVGMQSEDIPPAINSAFRLFARDMQLGYDQTKSNLAAQETAAQQNSDLDPKDYHLRIDAEVLQHPVSGVGGWKDDSPLMRSFRSSLQDRIGVTIPDSSLVVRSLAIYLVVLIPLNYLVFRWMGRLEWAWLAMVPIALVGAFMVARAAQLDMGFARSRNELAFLEVPSQYDRGHLTRTIAFYNSLASDYAVQFDRPDAAITMLASNRTDARNAGMFGNEQLKLQLGFDAGPRLEGISVGSNSYGSVHVEQMVPVGGQLSLSADGTRLQNDSDLDLMDAFVIRRAGEPSRFEIAVVGAIAPGESPALSFQDADSIRVSGDIPDGARQCMQRILASRRIPTGSTRLVARLAAVPPDQADDANGPAWGGLTVSPACSQTQADTIVMAHLSYPDIPEPQPDLDLADDFRRVTKQVKENKTTASPEQNDATSDSEDTSADPATEKDTP